MKHWICLLIRVIFKRNLRGKLVNRVKVYRLFGNPPKSPYLPKITFCAKNHIQLSYLQITPQNLFLGNSYPICGNLTFIEHLPISQDPLTLMLCTFAQPWLVTRVCLLQTGSDIALIATADHEAADEEISVFEKT